MRWGPLGAAFLVLGLVASAPAQAWIDACVTKRPGVVAAPEALVVGPLPIFALLMDPACAGPSWNRALSTEPGCNEQPLPIGRWCGPLTTGGRTWDCIVAQGTVTPNTIVLGFDVNLDGHVLRPEPATYNQSPNTQTGAPTVIVRGASPGSDATVSRLIVYPGTSNGPPSPTQALLVGCDPVS